MFGMGWQGSTEHALKLGTAAKFVNQGLAQQQITWIRKKGAEYD